jgi:hypothetical protein
MARKEYYRGIEDPIAGTFKLAEEVSLKADQILFKSIFSLYFVWFGLVATGLLMLTFLIQGNLFLFVIFLSVFIAGLVTVWLLGSIRSFLKRASFRISAIQSMREGPPFHKIPKGKTKTDRILKYLKKENESYSALLKRRPELLRKDSYIVGKKKRHHFEAFVIKKPSIIYRILGLGRPGYSLYIKEFKRAPDERDIRDLVKELTDIYQKNRIYPNRVMMLFKARSGYKGLDDDAYDWLVEDRIKIPGQLKRHVNIQVVTELPEGTYEFVPFIPELKDYLP